ncbi:MAG: M23 family metallopeptidase [Lachnospiraceae bacterium]|nr:M23 family metallopeptidase [Lachnospiraceae bacterium]
MKNQNRNVGGRGNAKKEKAIMIASSVFVLAALTMTGIYVNNNNKESQNDGYNIDFDMLENEAQDNQNIVEQKWDEIEEQAGDSFLAVPEDDLDYAPVENVDSGMVEIPGLTDNGVWEGYVQPEAVEDKEPVEEDIAVEEELDTTKDILEEEVTEQSLEELEDAQDQAAMNADAGVSVQEEISYEPDFVSGDTLVWPVSGSVLIPYSMDKTVRFATLEQYKYNPAMVLAATEGDIISAVAGGRVTDVFFDEEIGNAVTVDIGNGYEVTYGQLKDIAVAKGSYVEKGSLLGYVAAPTIYYSVEGTNAYFKLTLNGEPVDPLGQLQ